MEGSFGGVTTFPLLIEIRNDVNATNENGTLSQQIELLLSDPTTDTAQIEFDDPKLNVMQFLKYKKKPELPPKIEKPVYSVEYSCAECSETFESKEIFDIHMSGHTNNMKCAICNMVLKSLKNYEKHCLRCKPYECQICGRVVRFRPNFIKHMRVHTGQSSEGHKYKCEVCQKEFMSFEYFKVHKKIHSENVNLTCGVCGKVFSALASLRGHTKLHTGIKLHKCDVCGKGFGQRYNLKIHSRVHTGESPFECNSCGKKMHTQSSYQAHLQTHQRIIMETKNQDKIHVKIEREIPNENENLTIRPKEITKRENETQTDFVVKMEKLESITLDTNKITTNLQSEERIYLKISSPPPTTTTNSQQIDKITTLSTKLSDEQTDDLSENSSIISNYHNPNVFDYELIESNDLSNLFESSSIPESIPDEIYLNCINSSGCTGDNDDENFQLNRSNPIDLESTTDGNFIKKEWRVGKFDEDDDEYYEAASFIYD